MIIAQYTAVRSPRNLNGKPAGELLHVLHIIITDITSSAYHEGRDYKGKAPDETTSDVAVYGCRSKQVYRKLYYTIVKDKIYGNVKKR